MTLAATDNYDLRFGVVGDVHMGYTDRGGKRYPLQDRLTKVLQWYNTQPDVAAIAIDGDFTQRGSPNEWDMFTATWNAGRGKLRLIGVKGNHDDYPSDKDAAAVRFEAAVCHRINAHFKMKGYHLISLSAGSGELRIDPSPQGPPYVIATARTAVPGNNGNQIDSVSSSLRAWLRERINFAKADAPGKPVFIFHHWPLINTFYVSNEWYTTSFGTDPLTGWFKDDPEVVIFGAHIHSPNNEPRSIWQGAFTSLNAPCTNYIEIESGIFLGDSTDGISVSSFPKIGSQAHGQGLIVSVKGSRVTIDNYDFDMCEGHTSLFSVTKLPQTWEFDISKPDKFPYTRARRQNQKTSPVFDASAPSGPVLHRIKIIRIQSTSVEVEFSQARIPLPNPGNEVVHSYRFELINKNSGSVLIRKQWSDFMLTPRLQKPEYTQILGGLESGTIYELRIYAVSSFQDEWNKFIRTGTEAGECSSQYLSTEFTTY